MTRAKSGQLCRPLDVELMYDLENCGRRKLPNNDDCLQQFIEDNWQSKTKSNPRIYNAAKFRLASYSVKNDKPCIQIGLTTYKELLGTHYYPYASDLLVESQKLCDAGDASFCDAYGFMSNCLGVGAIAITSDEFVILLQRANWTGEAAGKIDRPGGHPEPDEVMGHKSLEEDLSRYKNLRPDKILEEIFAAPQKELRDEVNIALECQQDPQLLGLLRDLNYGGRCTLDFLIRVNLTKKEVQERYLSGKQSEADESTGLLFIEAEKVKNWDLDQDLISDLSGHGIGGLYVYHMYLKRA